MGVVADPRGLCGRAYDSRGSLKLRLVKDLLILNTNEFGIALVKGDSGTPKDLPGQDSGSYVDKVLGTPINGYCCYARRVMTRKTRTVLL